MEHLAIDHGGKESQICVRSSDGQIVEERRCRTTALPEYLTGRPHSRVVVETCSEAFGLLDAIATLDGTDAPCWPPTESRIVAPQQEPRRGLAALDRAQDAA